MTDAVAVPEHEAQYDEVLRYYALAKRAEWQVRDLGAGRLRLAVEDNGVGFDLENTSGRSIGSRLIHTFGLQVGGTSTIRSTAGTGTVVELIFPDPAKKGQDLEKASAA